jgi:hypothetical protein
MCIYLCWVSSVTCSFIYILFQVNIRAVPCDLTQTNNDALLSPTKRLYSGDEKNCDEHLEPPVLDVPYDVTTKDRMCLHAITFLKVRKNKLFN